MGRRSWTNAQFAEALRASKGMVYVAARQLGCDPGTIKARLRTSPELRAIAEAESEHVNDVAELKLYEAIMAGDLGAIKYRLSNRAKDRGYFERKEVATPPGQPLQVAAELDPSQALLSVLEKLAGNDTGGIAPGAGP